MKHEAPLEYNLAIKTNAIPSADLIEEIGYASKNPLFKKNKFRRVLIAYREDGLRCGPPRKWTPTRDRYHFKVRKKSMKPDNDS